MAIGLHDDVDSGLDLTSFLTTTFPTVFVTGGQGHVGRTLIPTLRQHGYNVHSLARTLEGRDRLRALGCASVQAGDVLCLQAIISAARGCTHFIHCASTFSHVDTSRTQYYLLMNKLTATHAVAACRHLEIRKLVLLSNCSVLCNGTPVVNADESMPLKEDPLGTCAKSMRIVERLILQANDNTTLQTCVIRPRLLWGGVDGDPFTMNIIEAARSKRLRLVSGGNFYTSTCHVRNACEAISCALRRAKGGHIYHVTDGKLIRFSSFIRDILKAVDIDHVDDLLAQSVPLFVARRIARLSQWLAQISNTKASLSEAGVCLVGQEMTICDNKARDVLAYRNAISLDEGMAQLRARKVPKNLGQQK